MAGRLQSEPATLSVRNICVAFGGLQVLRNVTLDVEPGKITGLIGPNGAGKTTLINVTSGFQRSASGTVRLGEADLTGLPAHKIAASGVSRSFQGGRLFSRMTVFENVFVAAIGPAAGSRAEAYARTMRLLRHFGLGSRSERFANEVPYGEERLLSVARCLASQPRFILLDEPAAGLNEAETRELKDALSEIPQAFGCGMLIVEHDMDLIASICSRVCVLANGANLADGTPAEVNANPDVIREYLGGEAHAA